jgi:CheY-like chemotaxis protein
VFVANPDDRNKTKIFRQAVSLAVCETGTTSHCILHHLMSVFAVTLQPPKNVSTQASSEFCGQWAWSLLASICFNPVHERRGMRVLIVDDERSIRTSTAVAIQAAGHNAETADSGQIAILKLQEDAYDLAFLDLRLGDEDGLEILEQIKRQHSKLPVVVFTAYASVASAVAAMQRGAFDLLPELSAIHGVRLPRPNPAPCSSTKLGSCPWKFNPSSFECCRSGNMNGWGKTGPERRTRALSRLQTKI